ncbi:MAG: stage III sporulation protein AE, partial [Clostridia bacterium]|nr:stage III sporulation protein AE [Clostridia bacterium]
PFLTIGAHYLAYKGTAALSLAITDKRIAELIDGVGTAFGLLLALVGAAGVFIYISLISSMKAVTG